MSSTTKEGYFIISKTIVNFIINGYDLVKDTHHIRDTIINILIIKIFYTIVYKNNYVK